MNPGNNFQSHIKKSTSQEITNSTLLKSDTNTKIINNQINKRNINPIRTRTPFHEENKSNPLEMQNSSMESRRTNYNRKYTSNTHNPLLVINSRRNKEEISKNDNNNNNTILYISKVKRTLNNQYNLSDDNLLKFRNSANSNTIINNNQLNNNRRSNQLSIDFNSKNNISNITSKYIIKEELNNKNYKNLQTKTTRVLKIKTNQIDNSNNSNKYPETNRRLNLKSVEPQKRNHNNTAIYTSNINNKNDQKKRERQNSYNNHKLYTSHYTRRNQRDSNTNIINSSSKQNTNNIKTTITASTYTNTTRPKSINNNINIIKSNNNHTIISSKNNTKEKEIEKKPEKNKSTEKPKEIHKTEYINKNPNITITSTYNSNSLKSQLNNNDFEEEEEDFNKPNNTMPSLMFDDDMDFGEFRPPIKLSSEIFGLYHPKFKPSIHSLENEFKNQDDFIKAYAYNTSEGNIREYNEDTITVTKINLNQKDKNDYFYFFAVYDGHGGNGCSLYLKNNLHKNITEFSTKGIKTAIEITENTFLSSKAIDYNYDLLDTSGSCGVILLIKKNKCIIANIGDSRLVMFKNKRVVFSTSDHKPNTYIEKHRIESQGGSVYQTTAAIPIYQNGKLIEIPWRVCPGGLSVSRTFGDIESKDERFGGKKGVVVALPDISEFELNDEYNFIVIGCDGIFDVLSNGEIIECIKIVLKINKSKNKKINELCGDFASMIIKSALAKESFDNVSCIVIVFNLKDFI